MNKSKFKSHKNINLGEQGWGVCAREEGKEEQMRAGRGKLGSYISAREEEGKEAEFNDHVSPLTNDMIRSPVLIKQGV